MQPGSHTQARLACVGRCVTRSSAKKPPQWDQGSQHSQSLPSDYGGMAFDFFSSLFFLCRGMGRTVIQLDKLLVHFSSWESSFVGGLDDTGRPQSFGYPLGPSMANGFGWGGCSWGKQSGFSCASWILTVFWVRGKANSLPSWAASRPSTPMGLTQMPLSHSCLSLYSSKTPNLPGCALASWGRGRSDREVSRPDLAGPSLPSSHRS